MREVSFDGGESWFVVPSGSLLFREDGTYVLRGENSKKGKAAEYARRNPLGGIANAYEVIASRIRAGEDEAAVLEDYNLMRKPK